MTRLWTDTQLAEAVNESKGITEVVRRLYGTVCGNNNAAVWRRISELHLDTNHFGGRAEPRKSDEDFLQKGRFVGSRILRQLLKKHKLYECCQCGNTGTHCNKPLTLQVEHRDGDRLNNELDNLVWMCPNCHSQTPTYGKHKFEFAGKRQQVITIRCSKCRQPYETDRARYELKKKRGQTNFYCGLKCASGSKVDDEVIWKKYEELGSIQAVSKALGIHWSGVDFRIKKIRSRLEEKTQITLNTGSSPVSGTDRQSNAD